MRKKTAGQLEVHPVSPLTAPTRASREAISEVGRVPWIVAFCVLSILSLTLMWYPIAKIGAPHTWTNFEGFSLYYQDAAAHGNQIYGSRPTYAWANYPPLSFHLIGWLGSLTHDINIAGRWVSFVSYLAIGVLMALIVERFTSSWRLGEWAALAWLVWLPAFDISHVPVNDPHMLGLALSVAGLYSFVRNPESSRWLCMSAVIFAISMFTKHSLVTFPAAVAIQLFLTSKRRFAIWLGSATLACLMLLLLTLAFDGRYFLTHMAIPRAYYPWDSLASTAIYGYFIQAAFAVALIWSLRNISLSPTALLIWAFVIAHAVGMVYCGGAGANINHFYDAIVSTAMLVALALPELERIVAGARFPRTSLGILLIVPFFLTTILMLPRRVYSDVDAYQGRERAEAEFAFVTGILKAQPGPALCENLPICYAAGKPEEYDAFPMSQLMRTSRTWPDRIAQLIQSRHFRAIQFEWHASEPMDARPRVQFPGPVMRALFASYQLKTRTDKYALFVPR